MNINVPEPRHIVALSDGPDNIYDGVWPDRILSQVTRAELHAYEIENPAGRVLVCGGGGYTKHIYDREGVDVALWLNGLGFDAYVLVHHLPGANNNTGVWPADIALTEGVMAVTQIKRDLPLFIIGLSSGGHLAGAITCQPGVAPAGLLIAYAPVNANHADYKSPAGKPDYPPSEKQAFYNGWPIGMTAEPHGMPPCPVFLAYALHDSTVPIEHALNFITSARDTGLDLDAHIFGQAPHGFALRERDGSHANWPELAATWLDIKLKLNGPTSRHRRG
jgi:acetyl esterase/lipase